VRELHPDSEVTPIGDGSVGDHSYPPDDTSYATVLPGAELFCDRRLVCDRPSRKPPDWKSATTRVDADTDQRAAGPCRYSVWSVVMGAIKPWHLLTCLVVVLVIVGMAVISARRKK
jgi:hypothetical protein